MDREARIEGSIDWQKGIEAFDDEEMFTSMVGKFESLTLNEELEKLYNAMINKDLKEIREHGHKLKGAAAYLAAPGIQKYSLQLQLECDAFHYPETAALVTEEQKVTMLNNSIGLYLSLLQESKYLKERIAQVTKQPCDLSRIEFYEKEIAPLYKTQSQPVCSCCKIF